VRRRSPRVKRTSGDALVRADRRRERPPTGVAAVRPRPGGLTDRDRHTSPADTYRPIQRIGCHGLGRGKLAVVAARVLRRARRGIGMRRAAPPHDPARWRHAVAGGWRRSSRTVATARRRDEAAGTARLEFEVMPRRVFVIRQTAIFDPWTAGRAYWYALYPLHQLVFGGMLRGIARAAERSEAGCGDRERLMQPGLRV